MQIYYGIIDNLIDVTNICIEKLVHNNIMTIPDNDHSRANFFTDPLPGVHKNIIILNNGVFTEYNEFVIIKINMIDNTITSINIIDKLKNIHSKLNIKYGNFNQELPEQKMAVRYLTGKEKVLEIGGNIGRNSLIIASILENNKNFVTLESNIDIANQLKENMHLNNMNFHIESSALSKRQLIQQGWAVIQCDILLNGYTWVNTITLDELNKKYNIDFDTLVLDCEGSFYYILLDMPEILNNINLIIMENDYHDISKKNFVDKILIENNFKRDYVESVGMAWPDSPCRDNFFEVWKK
jgi:FkbM family methyltransferase